MFQRKVNLSQYSNYKIGGPADYFFLAKNIDDLEIALKEWKLVGGGRPIFVIGGATNLLIDDKGFDGLVIKMSDGGIVVDGDKIRVGAGVMMAELLDASIDAGLSGLEWAGGLPGSVGGAIRGNAGAFGGETKDSVYEVASLDISGDMPRLIRRNKKECEFDYRNSIYKKENGKEIIFEATFLLARGDRSISRRAIDDKKKYRIERQPLEYPNIGSTFKNVDLRLVPERYRKDFEKVIKTDPFPVVPAAYLISEAGLKGRSAGGAMISPKHPNFIVNISHASSSDIKELIKLVKLEVKKKFDISLEEEIIYLGGIWY